MNHNPTAAEPGGPLHWPSTSPDDAALEGDTLRTWVADLAVRFPGASHIPDCWWKHNDLVEAFAALRDYEQHCYADSSPLSGAVEWHRAFRDLEDRWTVWIKRFRCGHDPSAHGQGRRPGLPPET